MIDQKEPKLDFKSDTIKNDFFLNKDNFYFKKVVLPTAKELETHKQYLKLKQKFLCLLKEMKL